MGMFITVRLTDLNAIKWDLIVFVLLSVAITLTSENLPRRFFDCKKWMFRERKWENGGRVYERLFSVKKWKPYVPDIGDILKNQFSKTHLQRNDSEYLSLFLMESCRSEFTHWMIICSMLTYVFWAGFFAMVRMLLLAVLLNVPYIIIQRYNRPRIIRLLRKNTVERYELSTVKA